MTIKWRCDEIETENESEYRLERIDMVVKILLKMNMSWTEIK
jgi:hypothetical protein